MVGMVGLQQQSPCHHCSPEIKLESNSSDCTGRHLRLIQQSNFYSWVTECWQWITIKPDDLSHTQKSFPKVWPAYESILGQNATRVTSCLVHHNID